MAKFRKKPVVIEAVLVAADGDHQERPDWLWKAVIASTVCWQGGDDPHYTIETLEGKMIAKLGDWIIRGVKGELYPCKPDIFEATYDSHSDDRANDSEPSNVSVNQSPSTAFGGKEGE